ncbi:MAG: ethanolamine permease [Bacteroidota bacterium]|nr:ethanolamine permease [Bacteroidota bacterium]
MNNKKQVALKRVLGPVHIWAIAVGLVISGEYFGWNYGWNVAGTVGMLWATAIVTVLYITFVFSFTELTTSIPEAGGPFAYAQKAFGPIGGLIAGYGTLIEFLLATPAIAYALGSYLQFLYPSINVLYAAIAFYILFTGINLIGIKESAVFTLIITLLAIAELLAYIGFVAPHFKMHFFFENSMPYGWKGIFAALPFAIWFYLAIEGVAMVAEETKQPEKNIPRGYIAGIFTLSVLALTVMIVTGGITDWKQLANIDYPLPQATSIVLGQQSSIAKLFAGIGLFGLIASFHSIITGYSRQIFALSRDKFLPRFLSQIHPRFKTPHIALYVGAVIGIISLYTGTTDKLIILSALGALSMYIISMLSLFKLRMKGFSSAQTFKVPFYPIFPAIALILSVICLAAIVYYNPGLGLLFLSAFLLVLIGFLLAGKHKTGNVQ